MTAHSLLLVIHALVIFGPTATVCIGLAFPTGWIGFNLSYSLGLAVGLIRNAGTETLSGAGWYLPVTVAGGSLLLGLLAGWFRHTE